MTALPDVPPICLMGPTASGKTDLAVRLVEALPLEIISVDSAMVYRGMDIGTAKPDAKILRRAPHRLVDIREPEESYSAGEFVRDAGAEMATIRAAGKVPLLVGGTMMYFRSLTRGMADLPPADESLRAAIDSEAAVLGWPAMHRQLSEVDAAAARRIEPNDRQRIQRALEVYRGSGKPLSEWQAEGRSSGREPQYLKLGLVPEPRAELHRRIEQRLQTMLDEGFIDEVAGLRQRPGLGSRSPSMRAVGYRQVWNHLDGRCSQGEAVNAALAATRQLAKRQMTWLRSEPGIHCLNPLEPDTFASILSILERRMDQY